MSMRTWRKEFYPTDASGCRKKNATTHSLRKWADGDPRPMIHALEKALKTVGASYR